jgi:hypothetical protein
LKFLSVIGKEGSIWALDAAFFPRNNPPFGNMNQQESLLWREHIGIICRDKSGI